MVVYYYNALLLNCKSNLAVLRNRVGAAGLSRSRRLQELPFFEGKLLAMGNSMLLCE
jgi:hypothetical protein